MGKNIIRARTNERKMSLLMSQDSPEGNLQHESGWKHKKTAGYIPAENVPGGSVMLLASFQYG